MGLFKKNTSAYDCRFSGIVTASEGVPQIPIKANFFVALSGNVIMISDTNISFTLMKEQVTAVSTYGGVESVSSSKSVIGRGVVGGLLAGSTGAVIGGLSGTKDKKKTVHHFYWYMCFSSSSGIPCRLELEVFPPLGQVDKFNELVRPVTPQAIQL